MPGLTCYAPSSLATMSTTHPAWLAQLSELGACCIMAYFRDSLHSRRIDYVRTIAYKAQPTLAGRGATYLPHLPMWSCHASATIAANSSTVSVLLFTCPRARFLLHTVRLQLICPRHALVCVQGSAQRWVDLADCLAQHVDIGLDTVRDMLQTHTATHVRHWQVNLTVCRYLGFIGTSASCKVHDQELAARGIEKVHQLLE